MSYLVCPRARPNALLEGARSLFEQFHCFAPPIVRRTVSARRMPPVLVRLGELKGVIYRSDRGQCGRLRTFVHFFETPPMLACEPDGRRLHVLGGRFQVGRRGIEG